MNRFKDVLEELQAIAEEGYPYIKIILLTYFIYTPVMLFWVLLISNDWNISSVMTTLLEITNGEQLKQTYNLIAMLTIAVVVGIKLVMDQFISPLPKIKHTARNILN